ncbi:MAG: 5'/3'-nucleotidase SurE [Magnetospiraceae bacterium]
MFKPPLDLKSARVLISNDDGIHAPGLKVLERVLRKHCREVWTVAPEQERSGAGHSLTLHGPLRLRHLTGRRYAVDGTPTDCVLIATKVLLKDKPPDLVISGINRGGNLGEDVTYSGTVAAAMEGTLLGFPSIALSQHFDRRDGVHWGTAETHTIPVLEKLLQATWAENALVNVNFPSVVPEKVQGISVALQGHRKVGGSIIEGRDPYDEPFYWIGSQRERESYAGGTDLDAVRQGMVTITPITLDMTHEPMMHNLREVFP